MQCNEKLSWRRDGELGAGAGVKRVVVSAATS